MFSVHCVLPLPWRPCVGIKAPASLAAFHLPLYPSSLITSVCLPVFHLLSHSDPFFTGPPPIPSRGQRADAMATGKAKTPRMPGSRGLFLLMWLFTEKVKKLMRLQTEETDGNRKILITADVEALPRMHCCMLIESARWVWIVKWDWDGCDGRAGPSHR